jgi:hypothetical protein
MAPIDPETQTGGELDERSRDAVAAVGSVAALLHDVSTADALAGRSGRRDRPLTDPLVVPSALTGVLASAIRLTNACASPVLVVVTALLAVTHLRDRYRVNETFSVWSSLASSAAHGDAYPALRDGLGNLAGTRYGPLPIAVQSLVRRAWHDDIGAQKLVSLVWLVALVVVMATLLRRGGLRRSLVVAIPLMLLATPIGAKEALTGHHDALAALLQVGCLAWFVSATRSDGHRKALVVAGILGALALLVKVTAVAAPLAVMICLVRRRRGALVGFASTLGVTLVAGVAATQWWTDGRYLDNIVGTAGDRQQPLSTLTDGVARLAFHVGAMTLPVVITLLVAGLLFWLAPWRPQLTSAVPAPYLIALAISLGTVTVMYTDPGIFDNHLLEPMALALLIAGMMIAALDHRPSRSSAERAHAERAHAERAHAAVRSTVAILSLIGAATLLGDVKAVATGAEYGRVPLAGVFPADAHVLSSDPAFDLSRGRRPVVMDPFMARRLFFAHPDWETELVERIDSREFTAVVLNAAVDNRYWFTHAIFGAAVRDAIDRNYRLSDHVEGMFVYMPR